MRKFSLLFIITFLIAFFGIFESKAQRVKGALIAGINLSQVDGDEIYGFRKPGLNIGASATVPVWNNFSFTIETIYNQKGAVQGEQYFTTDSLGNELNGAYKIQLDYLEVPFLIHYTDKDVIAAGFGFSYGRAVKIKEWEHGKLIEGTALNSGVYKNDDFNILADIQFRIYKKLKFNLRYSYSIAKIRTREFTNLIGDSWTRDQYNNLLSFRFIWMINENKRQVAAENEN
jgi:hypothetical protein